MGDLKGIEKARMELAELYSGIPDDSVNLTFQDLAKVNQNSNAQENMRSTFMETIQESKHASTLNKLPSLDFNRGWQESKNHHHLRDHVSHDGRAFESHRDHTLHRLAHHDVQAMHASHVSPPHHHGYDYSGNPSHNIGHVGSRHAMESNKGYDDVSTMSMNSVYGKSRRSGIPHSNICTICSTYIYIFRHRCLVCGRVYCRSCVDMGMGEMTEGRKCIQCLGRRFNQRYIQRAGSVGCCTAYPSRVKQAELRWAEKGPRRRGEKGYGHSTVMSRPMTPTSPHVNGNPPSFVSNASFSPYSPNHHHHHHHLPL